MKRFLFALIVSLFASPLSAQVTLLGGAALPATCIPGQIYVVTGTIGMSICTAVDVWTTVPLSGGAVAWGGITGTLANQTDLQSALDAKLTANGNGSSLTGLTKTQVGLGNADNTSDANKPVSSATQTALNGKQAAGTYATGTGTASGTNTGDQTITLTGDVTGTGTGSFGATIANGAVSLAKQANMATGSVVYRKTAGAGTPEVQTLATLKTDLAVTKADVGLGSVENTALSTWAGTTNVTTLGTIGTGTWNATAIADAKIAAALTGKSYAGSTVTMTGDITTSGGSLGYAAGSGGTVTQATSKSTGVTLNKSCGNVTMNGAALAAAAEVTFTVTNSTIGATDLIIVNHVSGGTLGAYAVFAHSTAAGSFKIMIGNMSAGSLSEALVIRFCPIRGVTS